MTEKQLSLDGVAKKRGRPSTGNALTGAERAKRARDKKAVSGAKVVNQSLSPDCSARYALLINHGVTLEQMIRLSHASFMDGGFDNALHKSIVTRNDK